MLEEGIFDIHCHIVPGVDDGAADIEETRKLLEMEYKQGVRNRLLSQRNTWGLPETAALFFCRNTHSSGGTYLCSIAA